MNFFKFKKNLKKKSRIFLKYSPKNSHLRKCQWFLLTYLHPCTKGECGGITTPKFDTYDRDKYG
jgi:hypothetical protein